MPSPTSQTRNTQFLQFEGTQTREIGPTNI